jgi:hypothetical protein
LRTILKTRILWIQNSLIVKALLVEYAE